jgi:hypothetical protein
MMGVNPGTVAGLVGLCGGPMKDYGFPWTTPGNGVAPPPDARDSAVGRIACRPASQ